METPGAPREAYIWRRKAWVDEQGQIAPGAYAAALKQRDAMLAATATTRGGGINSLSWTSRGPDNIGGRTRSLLIHPVQTNRLWAGAVGGGIWSSIDGGLHWTAINDREANLAICSMAMAPSDPAIMYAGTGEQHIAGDGVHGIGIYKSTDTGATWTLLPATETWAGHNVVSIAVSPGNPNSILVGRINGGVYRSTNGGATWSNPYSARGAHCVAIDPTNPNNCIAAILDYSLIYGGWFNRCVYSTNAGLSWSVCTGLNAKPGYGRIQLAYAPSSPNIVYATYTDGKVYKSTDGGKSYAPVTTEGSTRIDTWAAPLWVDPTNPDFIVTGTGTAHVARSTDGGVTIQQISNGYINTIDPHPDIQSVVADPGFNGTTNTRVYVTTDGATYRTDNIYTAAMGSGWTRLDKTNRTTQFYSAVGDGPTGRLYGGTQDNGCLLLKPGSDNATFPFGGDGGFSAIDSLNPNYIYGEFIYLMIHRAIGSGGGQYMVKDLADAGNAANFIAPFILDPNNPLTMLAGGNSLWRNTNARNGALSPWKSIRPGTGQYISAIAIAKGDSATIWIAQNDAKIYRTTTGTATSPTWLTVDDNGATNPLPARYVSRILIDPADKQTVYVCLGGFSPDNLWKTTDGGATWADITGENTTGLPSAPIRGIARHPHHAGWLYVATEVGIFTTTDGGAHWSTTNDGPANVSVDEINFLNNSTDTLIAGTHGRGLFTAMVIDCLSDTDHNGFVDTDDFDAFVAFFSAGDPRADVDESGFVDLNDFTLFVQRFEAGC
ncbi:MAG: hypothetical protein IT435_03280 [Phycisphaerales bacterium]|nr:hypothetical protein [Phycisphaerales bacterium]